MRASAAMAAILCTLIVMFIIIGLESEVLAAEPSNPVNYHASFQIPVNLIAAKNVDIVHFAVKPYMQFAIGQLRRIRDCDKSGISVINQYVGFGLDLRTIRSLFL